MCSPRSHGPPCAVPQVCMRASHPELVAAVNVLKCHNAVPIVAADEAARRWSNTIADFAGASPNALAPSASAPNASAPNASASAPAAATRGAAKRPRLFVYPLELTHCLSDKEAGTWASNFLFETHLLDELRAVTTATQRPEDADFFYMPGARSCACTAAAACRPSLSWRRRRRPKLGRGRGALAPPPRVCSPARPMCSARALELSCCC